MIPEAIKLNSILCNVPDYSKIEYEIITDKMFEGKYLLLIKNNIMYMISLKC